MKIEHTLRRPGGTPIQIEQTKYLFAPESTNPDAPHVAEVENEDHMAIFLRNPTNTFVPATGEKLPDRVAVVDTGVPASSGHPDLVQIVGDEPIPIGAVVDEVIKRLDISVAEWNGLAEAARFAAVEEFIGGQRDLAKKEQQDFDRLNAGNADARTEDALDKLDGAPEESNTDKPLAEMHTNTLKKLARSFGVDDSLERPALLEALAPFVTKK